MSDIGLFDVMNIVRLAHENLSKQQSAIGVQIPGGEVDNPPGWEDHFNFRGDDGITTVPPGAHDAQIPGKLSTHALVGPPGPELPGDAPGWRQLPVTSGELVGYGHHSTLTPEQAHAFQMMMLIMGHNGDTVGRGQVIDHPSHVGNVNEAPHVHEAI